ncbi:MAG: TonB-dependent receptor [Bacteroidetes bacterium]|nr:TonB-dependent receptor [Bacteroidota bacterium]MBU1484328.1 TonB-dependent receptor [Bacteroidota bacterium]MBU1760189.1 TonB-dependent receptor [Bacteroidota bacterium]MBU2266805.1 TonB-dependent receptor [Bacteroidota bacterium]MBU2377008.1 TonB-dependent receptor [Bacteroidota bacterium]
MKKLILFFTLFIIIGESQAQTMINGIVKDAKSNPISGVSISIKDSYDGTSSDSTGKFTFKSNESGEQWLVFSAIGFGTDSTKIILKGTTLQLNLILKEKLNALNAVTITAGTFEASDSKKGVVLNSLDVATTAGAQADVYAALQTLPGTQPAAGESGLFVRGGSAAETNTYFDGLLVKNPFNTQLPDIASRGRFSPFLFKGTTFSAGGYSAVYGQALSSALILESKDLPEKTTTDVSVMTVGLGIDQTIRFKNSALSIGGSYINLKPAFSIFKQETDWNTEPASAGGTVIYKWKTSKTGMLKSYSEYSKSEVSLNTADLNSQQKSLFSNTNNNFYTNLTYQDYIGNDWKIISGFSASNNKDIGLQAINSYGRQDRLLQGKTTFTRYIGQLSTLKFGGDWLNSHRDESWNGLSRAYNDQLFSAYAESDIFLSNALVARVGLRAEHSSYLNLNNLAPRLSLAYKTGKSSQVSLAYGEFFQNPEDQYLVQTNQLGFQKATHYLANFQKMANGQTFRIEAYYKKYADLVKSTPNLNNNGFGYARGIDLFWRDKKTFKGVDYWISYSYLDTKRDFRNYPTEVTPDFGAKHSLNIVYKQFFSKLKSYVGATYSVASGRPFYNPNAIEFMSDKTKTYQNLSVNVSYLTRVFNKYTVIYASVSNLPGFKNVYGYHYSTDGQYREAIQPPALRSIFLGMFITIGDNTYKN